VPLYRTLGKGLGGAAADGEPLADLYALDLGSLSWTRLPPGDQVLASDPYEAARRDPEGFKLEPEFVVALEMAEAVEDGKKTSREKRREKKKNLGDDDRDRDSNNETRDAAEFGKIGRYYAAESMLVMDPETEQYDATATPSYGTDTLEAFFKKVSVEGLAGQELGDQAVFKSKD